jgi:hypothetical protein
VTPQAVLIFTNNTTSKNVFNNDALLGIGASDEGQDKAQTTSEQNNQSTSNTTVGQHNARCIYTVGVAGGLAQEAEESAGTAWDATNIALDWSTSVNASYFNILAFAGIEHIEVGDFDSDGSGAGNQDVSTVYGKKPDLVIFFTLGHGTASGTSQALDAQTSFGFANKDTEQGCAAIWSEDANASGSNNLRAQRTDACIHIFTDGGDRLLGEIAAYADWPSDGFRITWTADTTGDRINYVAFWGVRSKISSIDVPTSTGNEEYDLGIPWTPEALMLISTNQNTVDGTKDDDALLNIGFDDGSNQGINSFIAEDGQSTTDSSRAIGDLRNHYLVNTTPAVEASSSLVSFDDDGFTLNWDNAPGTARKVIQLSMAGNLVPKAMHHYKQLHGN